MTHLVGRFWSETRSKERGVPERDVSDERQSRSPIAANPVGEAQFWASVALLLLSVPLGTPASSRLASASNLRLQMGH